MQPAFAAVFLILLTLGYLTHTKRLSPWVAGIGLEVAQIVFYSLLITVKDARAKYVSVVIATAATQSFFPIIWPGELCVTRTSTRARPRTETLVHGLADTVPPWTERIRATSGTTSAGLAIGITNASGRTRQGAGAERILTDSTAAL